MISRRLFFSSCCLALVAAAVGAAAMAEPVVGKPAPDFSAVDSNGQPVQLAKLKGRIVVLEWTNHECPYTAKHYTTGNLQALQAEAAAKGVVWLSVVSSAPGQQGYVDAARANALTVSRKANPAAVLLDPKGTLGHLYEARSTPHMFVIDAAGVIAYTGALDDKPGADPTDVTLARNYVRQALAALAAGERPHPASTRPYGCSVKYAPG